MDTITRTLSRVRVLRLIFRIHWVAHADLGLSATEPWDEMLDREVKALHDEKLQWETRVIERRRDIPARLNRISGQIEDVRWRSEWLPEDDVPTAGEFPLSCHGRVEIARHKPRGDQRLTGYTAEGGEEREIPKPPRHQEVVDTFTTVASNLSELVQVSLSCSRYEHCCVECSQRRRHLRNSLELSAHMASAKRSPKWVNKPFLCALVRFLLFYQL